MKTLRFKLFAFYFGSLALLAIFFYVVVHFLALPHATHTFLIILSLLVIVGFYIIYKITASLGDLSSQIANISSTNLSTRIKGISGDDEIGTLAHSFNKLLDRLDAAFTRERQFIGDMAHELKTPIATMRGGIEVVLGKPRIKDEYKDALENTINDIDTLSSTLNDVLDLAWSESPHLSTTMPVLNLSSLVEELTEILQKMADTSKITIDASIKKNVMIRGYKEKLARAILNIADNALKYTKKGSVTLKLTTDDTHATLAITDTGPGIPKEDIPHLFERFYRGAQAQKSKGSGLGLAIAQSIVHLHHGTIHLKSVPDKGTTFTIKLPASDS